MACFSLFAPFSPLWTLKVLARLPGPEVRMAGIPCLIGVLRVFRDINSRLFLVISVISGKKEAPPWGYTLGFEHPEVYAFLYTLGKRGTP